jgi:hypothetical protein
MCAAWQDEFGVRQLSPARCPRVLDDLAELTAGVGVSTVDVDRAARFLA